MGKPQTIITGDNSRQTEAAVEWLKEHGATVEKHGDLSIITLPATLLLEHGVHAWQYTVNRKADEHAGDWVEVVAHADPYEVVFYLERQ